LWLWRKDNGNGVKGGTFVGGLDAPSERIQDCHSHQRMDQE
jgi:hypothetical protein